MFEHSTEIRRHATFDDRFYEIGLPNGEGVFYPSVSTILSGVQVGGFLDQWKQEQAAAYGIEGARFDMYIRAQRGTRVHAACEAFCKGESLEWFDEQGRQQYDDFEWGSIVRFVQWMEATKATVLATEMTVFSHAHRYAGTLDLIVEIEGMRYVVDIKTSKQVSDSHLLQVTGYRLAVEEMFPQLEIHGAGVLALNTAHKAGYHWKLIDDPAAYAALRTRFLKRVEIFHLEHPDFQPKRDILPTILTPTHIIGEAI